MCPKHADEFDDDEEDWDTPDDEDDGYIPCPYCGETMLEAADHCPYCDRWITAEDLPQKKKSGWVIAVIVLLVVAFVLSSIRF